MASLIKINPTERASLELVRQHPWTNVGYEAPPPTYLEDRKAISQIDEKIFDVLLTYSFEPNETRALLLRNEPSVVLNFYNLLLEKQAREVSDTESILTPNDADGAEDDDKPANKIMVRNLDTDEVMPIDKAERRIRREMFKRKTSQHYFESRADKEVAQ